MFGSLQKWNKCFFATLKIYSLNHLWVGQYPQGLLTPHRTIQKIKLYFWEFCPNISWTPTGIALVETKLCPLDCATTIKLQQRLERQGLLHKSFYVWSTGGKPKDRTCMDSLTICLLNTVYHWWVCFQKFIHILHAFQGCGAHPKQVWSGILNVQCPGQSCCPSQAAKVQEFPGRFSRSLNSIYTEFLARKGGVSKWKFNIW